MRPDGVKLLTMKSKKLAAPAASTRSPATASVRSPSLPETRTPAAPATGARASTNTRISAPASTERTAEQRDRIAARAYAIWLESGQPDGRDMEHWLEAERQLGLDDTAASLENRATHTSATAREIGSDEFRDRVEETMDEIASPSQQRSSTGLDV